jgi:hypothetical protein
MNTTSQLIPMNAYQQWEAAQRRSRNYAPTIQTHTGHPLRNVQVTRPINPWGPSQNSNEIPFRGWNANQLNTYMIPPHDQQQLMLFNKYVLHQDTPVLNQKMENGMLLAQAQKNINTKAPSRQTHSIKNRFSIGGGTTMRTNMMV